MTWTVPLESAQRWAASSSPFALHARRRWLNEAGPRFAVLVTRHTADLEDELFRGIARLEGSAGDELASAFVALSEHLYFFHLVWRVPTPQVRAAIDALTTRLEAHPELRREIDLALAGSSILPFPPGPDGVEAPLVVFFLEGLLPAKRPKSTLTSTWKALAKEDLDLEPPVLAQRLQALAAHPRHGSPGSRLARLPTGPLAAPVLASMLNAVSSFADTRARGWCADRREEAGRLFPTNGAEWGDPYARDAFLIEQAARHLGWGPEMPLSVAPAP